MKFSQWLIESNKKFQKVKSYADYVGDKSWYTHRLFDKEDPKNTYYYELPDWIIDNPAQFQDFLKWFENEYGFNVVNVNGSDIALMYKYE